MLLSASTALIIGLLRIHATMFLRSQRASSRAYYLISPRTLKRTRVPASPQRTRQPQQQRGGRGERRREVISPVCISFAFSVTLAHVTALRVWSTSTHIHTESDTKRNCQQKHPLPRTNPQRRGTSRYQENPTSNAAGCSKALSIEACEEAHRTTAPRADEWRHFKVTN
jgi:hypothetical protein